MSKLRTRPARDLAANYARSSRDFGIYDVIPTREKEDWELHGFWKREEAERRMPVTIIQVNP